MTDEQKDKFVNTRLTEDEYDWLGEQADRHGIGRGTLIRMFLKRVRRVGEGDALEGLVGLQQFHVSDGMEYRDEDSGQTESGLDAFRS